MSYKAVTPMWLLIWGPSSLQGAPAGLRVFCWALKFVPTPQRKWLLRGEGGFGAPRSFGRGGPTTAEGGATRPTPLGYVLVVQKRTLSYRGSPELMARDSKHVRGPV